ncbi:MAG: Asp-tRNA(Asn)/Glu-tRNA(Gln) amidotransferase subunit GatB [Burkholderiaceae bacterium]|nr:Asp-tRNA(Asn)/Glu-tRNA(Gln) amidotransferase subunit GatB [Burkholderiaceae bacterium]
MQWEIVVGLETHVQLATRSKMFSDASTAFGAAPNTQASFVDLALPGVLPVANRAAVECALRFGLAVGAQVARRSVFARKNYFYPDLPKGYQISQFEIPVVSGGALQVLWSEGDAKAGGADGKDGTREPQRTKQREGMRESFVRLVRAHLEEDAGKSLHEDFHGMTGIDLNRAGTALLEIVTEPDMRSAREAAAYARTLHALVVWLGICDGNLQEGSFRCDANVSVRPMGQAALGTRCEIKNLNSFRFLERAIEHEAARQVELISDGGRVVQETRLYDPERDETRSMRGKEDAHDYRYFPDPDLPPLEIDGAWIERVRATMPELPAAMRDRFAQTYGLSAYDAATLTASRGVAGYYEAVLRALPAGAPAAATPLAKAAANWVMGELAAALNRDQRAIEDCPVAPEQLARLVVRIDDGTISGKTARDVFADLWGGQARDADAVDRIVDAKGLRQMSDAGELERIVDEVIADNARSVEEFRAGREKAFNALVGQVMKATRGKANPQQVNELLRRRLQ